MDVATMVVALSAADQITELYASSTLVSVDYQYAHRGLQDKSCFVRSSTYLARIMEAAPALGARQQKLRDFSRTYLQYSKAHSHANSYLLRQAHLKSP